MASMDESVLPFIEGFISNAKKDPNFRLGPEWRDEVGSLKKALIPMKSSFDGSNSSGKRRMSSTLTTNPVVMCDPSGVWDLTYNGLNAQYRVDLSNVCIYLEQQSSFFVDINYNSLTKSTLEKLLNLNNFEGVTCKNCYANVGAKVKFSLSCDASTSVTCWFGLSTGGGLGFNIDLEAVNPVINSAGNTTLKSSSDFSTLFETSGYFVEYKPSLVLTYDGQMTLPGSASLKTSFNTQAEFVFGITNGSTTFNEYFVAPQISYSPPTFVSSLGQSHVDINTLNVHANFIVEWRIGYSLGLGAKTYVSLVTPFTSSYTFNQLPLSIPPSLLPPASALSHSTLHDQDGIDSRQLDATSCTSSSEFATGAKLLGFSASIDSIAFQESLPPSLTALTQLSIAKDAGNVCLANPSPTIPSSQQANGWVTITDCSGGTQFTFQIGACVPAFGSCLNKAGWNSQTPASYNKLAVSTTGQFVFGTYDSADTKCSNMLSSYYVNITLGTQSSACQPVTFVGQTLKYSATLSDTLPSPPSSPGTLFSLYSDHTCGSKAATSWIWQPNDKSCFNSALFGSGNDYSFSCQDSIGISAYKYSSSNGTCRNDGSQPYDPTIFPTRSHCFMSCGGDISAALLSASQSASSTSVQSPIAAIAWSFVGPYQTTACTTSSASSSSLLGTILRTFSSGEIAGLVIGLLIAIFLIAYCCYIRITKKFTSTMAMDFIGKQNGQQWTIGGGGNNQPGESRSRRIARNLLPSWVRRDVSDVENNSFAVTSISNKRSSYSVAHPPETRSSVFSSDVNPMANASPPTIMPPYKPTLPVVNTDTSAREGGVPSNAPPEQVAPPKPTGPLPRPSQLRPAIEITDLSKAPSPPPPTSNSTPPSDAVPAKPTVPPPRPSVATGSSFPTGSPGINSSFTQPESQPKGDGYVLPASTKPSGPPPRPSLLPPQGPASSPVAPPSSSLPSPTVSPPQSTGSDEQSPPPVPSFAPPLSGKF